MATQSLSSLGYLAPQLRHSVSGMRRAIQELEIEPAAVIDGIEHYDDAQVEAIRQHLEPQLREPH
jgi:hypothetical protein